ncbi:MAG: hypothetical protein SP4CHLAM5_00940 [Chlamydiia bacterium]|nr:hypothetical protein [Chlamydiia bacterium]MCH9617970.1 hypothetical protein [Chlamydiia bacterium]MCH9623705.1 hypothetical protein [Chlamydiia bacterium]
MSLSNYVEVNSPVSLERYGGVKGHNLYLKLSEETIASSVKLIQERVESSTPAADIFFKLFDFLRKKRGQIAQATQTPNAETFGALRTFKKITMPFQQFGAVRTSLYLRYNKRFITQLAKKMGPMDRSLTEWKQREIKYGETVFNRKVAFQVEVLTQKNLRAQRIVEDITEKELQALLGTEKTGTEIYKDWNLMLRLKQKHSEVYQRIAKSAQLKQLITCYPSPKKDSEGKPIGDLSTLKNLFVFSTVRIEINRKLYALGKQLTWMYTTHRTDPVERMKEHSQAIVIHQDVFLIDETLKAIAQVFGQAILWDKKTQALEELKDKVALIRFMYAFCMPCLRGDGAIGDWMELAIYKYHGFLKTRHNSKMLPCFEPLASTSLSSYRKRYDKTIKIEE